jgi:hypothetical protein
MSRAFTGYFCLPIPGIERFSAHFFDKYFQIVFLVTFQKLSEPAVPIHRCHCAEMGTIPFSISTMNFRSIRQANENPVDANESKEKRAAIFCDSSLV